MITQHTAVHKPCKTIFGTVFCMVLFDLNIQNYVSEFSIGKNWNLVQRFSTLIVTFEKPPTKQIYNFSNIISLFFLLINIFHAVPRKPHQLIIKP